MGFDKKKRPLDVRTAGDPDFKFDTMRETLVATTAASTSLGPRGVFALSSTSTTAPIVHTIGTDYKAGDRLSLMVDTLGATSGIMHVNFGSATVAATSADMVVLSSNGAGVRLVAISTSRWLTDGNQGATFSTST